MSRCSISNWARTDPSTELSAGCGFAAFAGDDRLAADLAGQGFQQAPHPLQFAGEFGLLLAGKAFLLAEGLGLFGRAAAHGVQFGFQGRALLEPLGLLLPRVLEDVGNLRVVRRPRLGLGKLRRQGRKPRQLALDVRVQLVQVVPLALHVFLDARELAGDLPETLADLAQVRVVVEEPLIAGADFRPALLRLLLIGLQLAVQLLKFSIERWNSSRKPASASSDSAFCSVLASRHLCRAKSSSDKPGADRTRRRRIR